MRTIRFLLEKEFKQIFRKISLLPLLLVLHKVQLFLLSYAANYEIKNLQLSVVDNDHSAYSRKLINKFKFNGYFKLEELSNSVKSAEEDLLEDKTDLVLVIPHNFEKNLVSDKKGDLQLLVNAINSVEGGIANAYASEIIRAFQADITIQSLGVSGKANGLEVVTANWYNPELNYKTFMVPGILVELITLVSAFIAALNIVREKEIGTIEQLNVTPVSKIHFILGKLIPFWIFAMYQLTFGLIIARFFFHVPIVGSLLLLYGITALFLFIPLGLGLLISAVSQTQQQAMFIAFFFILNFILLCGLFTPVENMPMWAQYLNMINPLKYIIEISRMILLKGSKFENIQNQFYIIVVMAIVVNFMAAYRYRKTTG